MKKNNKKIVLGGSVFALPWIIGFIVFYVVPIFNLMYYSFTDFNLFNEPTWIGLNNYKDILNDPKIWQSLKVTSLYVVFSVVPRLGFALMIAVRLNQKRRGIGIYRTIFYIPSILGGSVAVAVLWRMLFSRDGVINTLLGIVGIQSDISYIAHPDTALGTLILLAIWQFGSSMLIFLAGLKNISNSYYEAAAIDGAGSFSRFRNITLPLLTPVILFNLVMQIINGFMTFTQGYIITKGGPMNQTLFYVLYMYRKGFESYDMGYASAMAWLMLIIVGILSAIVFATSSKWVFYETKEN